MQLALSSYLQVCFSHDVSRSARTSLSSKDQMRPSSLPKFKMKRAETKDYVKWGIEEIKKDRASFHEFCKRKGIIAARERFLKFLKTEQGMEALTSVKNGNEKDSPEAATDKSNKTIILYPWPFLVVVRFSFSFRTFYVLIFSFTRGRTSVSLALAHIFGFRHIQSHVKNAAPAFIRNVFDLLHKHDVVIADKYVILCLFTFLSFYSTILNDRNNPTSSNTRLYRRVLNLSFSPCKIRIAVQFA
jgi:tRNA ligase